MARRMEKGSPFVVLILDVPPFVLVKKATDFRVSFLRREVYRIATIRVRSAPCSVLQKQLNNI
jgi:hypothetical protein